MNRTADHDQLGFVFNHTVATIACSRAQLKSSKIHKGKVRMDGKSSAMRRATPLVTLFFAMVPFGRAVAGPPFLTDDPVPTEYRHYEAYTFATADKTAGVSTTTQAPAVEFNWGALPNTQISFSLPYTFLSVPSIPGAKLPQSIPGTTVSGFGDAEFGVKYRFLQETAGRPQMSFYPSIEIPTGNSENGIGNGRTWYRLPIWMQKSWGKWTTYGGGGYALNSMPGTTNYVFGGWLVQRDFSDYVTVGAEVYYEGPQFVGDRSSTFYNVGSYISLTKNFGILFSLGHTFAGDDQSVAYFAFGWTGALHKAAALLDAATPRSPSPSALLR